MTPHSSMLRGRVRPLAIRLLPAILVAGNVGAHHSFAKFDLQAMIEIEGEISDVRWQNPHVNFGLTASAADGTTETWTLETNSPGILRRIGINDGNVAVGDRVRVAGNPAVDGSLELNATNMLLPDGRELLLGPRSFARFEGRSVGDRTAWNVAEGDPGRPELGLFRVWSTTFASRGLFAALDYPLTPAARREFENFDAVAGSQRLANDCTPKGMPWIMEQPYDIAFERDGEDILFKLEEFDTVRRIRMYWQGDRSAEAYSILGFSTGAWEDGTLVVTTTNLNSPNFMFEISASEQSALVERFTPSTDGARLDYQIVVTDPVTFTEPVRMEKFWIYVPSQAFDPYNCGQPLTP